MIFLIRKQIIQRQHLSNAAFKNDHSEPHWKVEEVEKMERIVGSQCFLHLILYL